ncbi:MAG: hypothetical protein A3E01_09910 [Gammaproteobacteria bacterium RIFCSPHIGHO2_12_FULL_63_22]|nr:MAG: hypothetical protein A3E01_09910 [Gammaproteobacteria bacterium RIFCSPHIGHO2_12_FULL_63_22]
MAEQMRQAGSAASAELKSGLAAAAQTAAQTRTQVETLNRELRQATGNIGGASGVRGALDAVMGPLRQMGLGFTAIGAAYKAWDIVKTTADIADQAQVLGISTDALQAYRGAAVSVGADTNFVDAAIQRFTRSIGENRKEFQELGISAFVLGKGPEAALPAVANALLQIADGSQRARIETQLFGRAGQEVEQVLRQWADPDIIAKMDEMGLVIDKALIARADKVDAAFSLFFTRMKVGLGEAILDWERLVRAIATFGASPALEDAARRIQQMIPKAPGASKDSPLRGNFPLPGDDAFLGDFRAPVGKFEAPDITVEFVSAKQQATELYSTWRAELQETELRLKMFGDSARSFELNFWREKLQQARGGGEEWKGIVAQINSQLYQIENARYQEEVRAAVDAEQKKQESLKRQLEAQRKHNEEMLTLVREQVRILSEEQKNREDMPRKEMEKAVDAVMKPWERAVRGIGSGFEDMFRGVLQGTQTFRQMMANMATNIALTFARMGIKILEDWALTQIKQMIVTQVTETGKTAAVATGETARVGIRTAAAIEGAAVEQATGAASVLASANKAAAGAFSAVAGIPYVGPFLAPVAAAAAFAGVMAFNIFSAEGGFDVPAGMSPVTQLHENEMVLPANIAEGIRDMTGSNGAARRGGAGRPVNFHIHAVDARSVLELFNQPQVLAGIKQKLETIS